MLQFIRSKAASLVVKILFALLIVTFGVWGIGDVLLKTTVDTTVATVGGTKISAEQLNQEVRAEISRLRGVFGGNFDVQQAKQLGIVDQQLDALVNDTLINLETDRLKLAVGDQGVRDFIMANQMFKNAGGQFDPGRYQAILAQNRLTPQQYEARVHNDLVRSALIEAVGAGGTAPKPLVDALYRIRAEKRVADTVFIPFASVTDVGEPSEAELTEFHDKHPEQFRAPELRSFTVASLTLDDLAKGIKPSADEVSAEYQKRIEEFKTPERRHLEQILVSDQATADQAEAALKGGRTFAVVAKDVAKLPTGAIDVGTVAQSDLPDEVADIAFKLPQDGISDPIKSPFGWHIVHVLSIEPAKTETFDAVKARIANEIARDQAEDQMSRLTNKVDDALAGGADLDKVAGDVGLTLAKVADTDQAGHTIDGGAVAVPQPASDILATAFGTDQGQVSGVTETQDGGLYVVRVDKVTPAAVRPLAEVRDQALKAWQRDQRMAAVAKRAKEILDAVNGGSPLKDVAAQQKLTVTTTPKLEHSTQDAGLPVALVGKLFDLKPRQAASGESGDGVYVAQLTDIIAADPAAAEAQVQQLQRQLNGAMQADLLVEFERGLRQRFAVSVDQTKVDRAF